MAKKAERAVETLRVPRDMVPLIQREADKAGVSKNEWMSLVLAAAVGYRKPVEFLPPMFAWGSEGHGELVAKRLGLFQAKHLALELQIAEATARERIQRLLRDGLIIEDTPREGHTAAIYRWVGPEK